MSTEMDTPPNPYESMTDEAFKEHVEKIAKVYAGKKSDIDIKKVFGLTEKETEVSEEIRNAMKSKEQFLAMAKQVLVEAGEIKDEKKDAPVVDPTVERIAQKSVDDLAGEIRAVHKDIPLDGILKSERSVIDKLDILGSVKEIAGHYKGVVDGLKKTIDEKSETSREKFTATGGAQSGDWAGFLKSQQDMVNKMIKTEEN